MTKSPATPTVSPIATLLAETTHRQSQAADPAASVWVSANAGTGKTHVLTQRVLRLLLTGVAPETILCLTYTKAAAAEMSKRVFDRLAAWVGFDQETLETTLAALLGHIPSADETDRARTLFARAIETPGGFKVQTIHAFCERLLQRFPLEAGVAPGFEILDEQTGRQLITEAITATLEIATRDPLSPLGQALTTAIRYAIDEQFDAVLGDAINKRALLEALIRRSALDDATDTFASAQSQLHTAFNINQSITRATLESDRARLVDTPTLIRLRDALNDGTKSDQNLAADVARAIQHAGTSAQWPALCAVLLTKEGTARARLMTKAVAEANPALADRAASAQAQCLTLDANARALDCIDATLALYRIAAAVLQHYATAKASRAALDFEDLITKTGSLLEKPEGAAWVLYKLDSGLKHILVDEAQDTAPPQWVVIENLVREFFSDASADTQSHPRTVFAVGDEKQSIYSFQGAEPKMFAAKGRYFESLAKGVGSRWHKTALTLSFRTVAPVLKAVDLVFANPALTPGLSADTSIKIQHAAKRLGQGGLVEIWPCIPPADKDVTDAWSPLDESTPGSPVGELATRIATTIKTWLDTGEQLSSQDRAIRPGDIIILVRKRRPFAPAIVAALKANGIPVAGADRLTLTDQIGVQDLLALGDFLTLPEDDLALATVLKSPLIGFDDNDLLALAPARKGTLWKALLDAAPLGPRFIAATDQLKRWRKDADFMPPFEFFADMLDRGGVRTKLLERLGPQAADALDEFLNFALTYDDSAPPSLTGFLMAVREGERTIKRDMDQGRNEVRILTVHGAKGLEAPIVFLPDTCTTKSGRMASGLISLVDQAVPTLTPQPIVWPVKGTAKLAPITDAKAAIKTAEAEELNRLLYVALTRPRDRLYVAGAQTAKSRPVGCWYDLIVGALEPIIERITLPDGTQVSRLTAHQTADPDTTRSHLAHEDVAQPRPAWINSPAPRTLQPTIPLAPSRLTPFDIDDSGEPLTPSSARPPIIAPEPVNAAPSTSADTNRFLRGTLTHALLEHLPSLDPDQWQSIAERYIAARGQALSASVRKMIVKETLNVLNDPVFAPLFSAASRAEVPIVAELPNPSGKGPALKLNGQIDRLAHVGNDILLVDYKTNRPAPRTLAEVPEVYLLQMAAYRAAITAIFPNKSIKAALLWTQTAHLMPLPDASLDAFGARLWDQTRAPT